MTEEEQKILETVSEVPETDPVKEDVEQAVLTKLQEVLATHDDAAVKAVVDEVHPVDLAIALEDIEDNDILYLSTLLSSETLADILEQAEENLQNHVMQILDVNRIIQIFHYMSKDDIVDILGELPANRRKEIVNLMKFGDRQTIRNLLGYDEHSAGGIMTTEYITVRSTLTVSQALEKVKEIAPKTEEINTI